MTEGFVRFRQTAVVPNRNYQEVLTHTPAMTRFLFNHAQCRDKITQNVELRVWKKHLALQNLSKQGAQPSAKATEMNRGWQR